MIGLLLSADLENDSDTLAIIGASTALYISDIPFDEPGRRGARRLLGRPVRGQPEHRPSCATKSKLNLLVAGTEDAIVMVESGAQEITEAEMVQALAEGHAVIKQIVALQKELRAAVGQAEAARSRRRTLDPGFVA